MPVLHGLECRACGVTIEDAYVEVDALPPCECGKQLTIWWGHGQPPTTDVFGVPQYSDATGEVHSSQRDKVRHMKEWGFEEAGDKVGGARNDHTLKNSTFSFAGQTTRRTVAEG